MHEYQLLLVVLAHQVIEEKYMDYRFVAKQKCLGQ